MNFTRNLLRILVWVLARTIYRVREMGHRRIPGQGGALLVCNHLSFIDAILLQATSRRPIRFIMYKGIYEQRWVRPWARAFQAIPISSELRPREMLQSLHAASEAIRSGELVCIFAEGQITRIGQLLPFRRGFERIMKGLEAPIIPIALDGVWGSIFSFEKGRFVWKLPREIPYPVTVHVGEALPHDATPATVRQAVQELLAQAWGFRKERMKALGAAFVATARRHPFRLAMADAQTPRVSFAQALLRAMFLAQKLKPHWQGKKLVGILLPPSVPGALVNYAALIMGRTPVNLNYTLSSEALASCMRQCELDSVVTSKTFLSKLKLEVPGKAIYLEELVAGGAGWGEKLQAIIAGWFYPGTSLPRHFGCERAPNIDDLATVIFSSGSTGDPKGVLLSHYNIASNVEQLGQVFGLNHKDGMVGLLPFFHSFGFTSTLGIPSMLGITVVYHPNPLEAKAIGPLISKYSLTFLLATPTFLQLYMRGCAPEDFGSLRVVMTGAEKLPDRLSLAFEEQFGIRPLEGYGCTECGPAVAVNTHDFRSAGFRQIGAKRGKIGHPLPSVSVRIVDTQTPDPFAAPSLPLDQPGLMLVRGPNVMQGYLGRPEKTAEVLRDGWYVTGDVAALDEDGFLQITDRLNRFSKIGGEMVPHVKVEEKLHELADRTEQSFVVTGVPDDKKGERLVVLHKMDAASLAATLEKLTASDLPNLWKPRADQFIFVDAFPMLGTGKLDLRKIREVASSRAPA